MINERHPLNPRFIQVGSEQFHDLCQKSRYSSENRTETSITQAAVHSIWQQNRPGMTSSDALLLSGAGNITLELYNLPLHLIIYIANFLYPSNDQHKAKYSKPFEWLIFSALYRQIHPDISYNAQLQTEIDQKKYLCVLFHSLLHTKPSDLDDLKANTNIQKTTITITLLLEAAIKESEHAVVVTASRAAYQLTEPDNAQQLIAVSSLGTYAQKTSTLYYLLDALCGKYSTCKVNFKEKNQKHQQAYTSTRRYFYFIKGYYSSWLQELKKSMPKEKSIEQTIIADYPKYFSCAKETLRDYKPLPSASNKSGLFSKMTGW